MLYWQLALMPFRGLERYVWIDAKKRLMIDAIENQGVMIRLSITIPKLIANSGVKSSCARMIPETIVLWLIKLNSISSAKFEHSSPPVTFYSNSLILWMNMFGTKAWALICIIVQSPTYSIATSQPACSSRRYGLTASQGTQLFVCCLPSAGVTSPTCPQLI